MLIFLFQRDKSPSCLFHLLLPLGISGVNLFPKGEQENGAIIPIGTSGLFHARGHRDVYQAGITERIDDSSVEKAVINLYSAIGGGRE